MTLQVTHVVRQYHPSVGGMEEVVRNIAARQRCQPGHAVRIVTLNRLFRNDSQLLAPEDEFEGVPVRRLPFSGSSRYPLCPGVLHNLGQSDIVHVHGVDFFYDFLALTKVLHRRPLVLSTHGGFFHTAFASRLKQAWFNTITRASSLAYERVIATSDNDGDTFSRIVSPARLEIIENGVNTDKFAGKGSRELRSRMIYFGRWSSNKGLSESIDLMEKLVAENRQWQLVIAGREYDYTEKNLLELVESRGLRDHVRVVPNPEEEELRELIGDASYFLCLSRHEGFGLAAIEAMSAGLVPVLSDIPPFRKLVEAAGTGVAGEASDSGGLAGQVQRLHKRGTEAYLSDRNRVMALAGQYSWHRVADRYVELYERIGGAQ